jgi:opacity protein-like surface antigen
MKQMLGLVLLVLVLGVSGVSAIDTGVGVRGYFGVNTASGDDWDDLMTQPGVSNWFALTGGLGITADYAFSKKFGIGTEIVYGKLSGKGRVNEDTYLIDKVKVIQVPLFLKLAFGSNEKKSTYIYGGPECFFVVGDAEDIVSNNGDEVSTDFATDKSFALGFAVGIGTEYRMGSGALVLDTRYVRTITEIFDGAVYFNSLQVGLGYKFLF